MPAQAQRLMGQIGTDSVSTSWFPVFGYSSDIGFLGGAVYSRHDYQGNVKPYNNYLKAAAMATTKGFVKIEGEYIQTLSLNSNIRSAVKWYFNRLAEDNYFGIGNTTAFDKDQWEDGYYFFESINFGTGYLARIPLWEQENGNSQLDASLGLETEYYISYAIQPNTRFDQHRPNGNTGGWLTGIAGGFTWENRDSEFDPHRGNYAELEVIYAPWLINKYDITTVRLQLRQYFYLFNWVTVAGRLEGRHAGGDVPFWKMPTLGDDYTLRGFPLNRYKGRSSLAYTLEFRAWVFEFPEYGIKLGGQLFTDVGRVFTRTDDFRDLFEGYHQTAGIGGAMSLFNPDFILRGDIGFSDELTRIYVGVGYMF